MRQGAGRRGAMPGWDVARVGRCAQSHVDATVGQRSPAGQDSVLCHQQCQVVWFVGGPVVGSRRSPGRKKTARGWRAVWTLEERNRRDSPRPRHRTRRVSGLQSLDCFGCQKPIAAQLDPPARRLGQASRLALRQAEQGRGFSNWDVWRGAHASVISAGCLAVGSLSRRNFHISKPR